MRVTRCKIKRDATEKISTFEPSSCVAYHTDRLNRSVGHSIWGQKIDPPLPLPPARCIMMIHVDPVAIKVPFRIQHHNLSTEIPSSFGMKRIHLDHEIDPRKTEENSTHKDLTY
ncbi:hypothetical protein [Serratia sp. OS31]|uniref:hypothetical protein n=1 Tax=Serratia sp. OS31 TaxID=2760844 RepID=UPI0015FECF9D|nr:hypothetical protein [Serratia sp. OS31]MBB1585156.1 hypothetical protein [Serratia sp. OS31]